MEEAALEEVWNRLVAAEAALKAAALKDVWKRLEAADHASRKLYLAEQTARDTRIAQITQISQLQQQQTAAASEREVWKANWK